MARDKNNENDSADDGAGSGVASTLWWGAAAVLVLALLGLVWVLAGGNTSKPAASPTRTVTASPTVPGAPGSKLPPAAAPSETVPGGCIVPGANSTVPTTAIPATWQAVGGIAVPVSVSMGPKLITGKGNTLRSCYQRSPSGAVIAAMNIAGAGTTSNAAQVIQQGFTPGPGRTEAQQQPADSGGGSVAGFQAQACTQAACLVKIVFAVQGLFVEQTMPMVWADDDWKVNGQVTGVAQAVRVSGLVGYTPMSPVGGGS